MTATATKAELAEQLAKAEAEVARIKAQLARPVLPEGWVDAETPPDEGDVRNYRVLLSGWRNATQDNADEYESRAWYSHASKQWNHPGDSERFNEHIVAYRKCDPADWLAPVEATAADAEAMVKPVVKESLTAEATTEQLAKAFDRVSDGGREMQAVDYDAIRARILAFDHSVDLRGVWCLKPDECKDGKWRLAYLVSRHERRVGMAVWVGGRWHDQCGALSAYTAVERLADPAAFMPKGGGE